MDDVGLAGRRIEAAFIEGYQLILSLDGECAIRVEGRCELRIDSSRYAIDPDNSVDDPHAGHLADIIRATVISASTDDAGTLSLIGDRRRALVVPADPEFEAWQVARGDGSLVVCGPSGRLSFFEAR